METCNEIVAARKWCQQTLFCRGLQPKKLIRSRNNKLLKNNNVKINHIENDSHEKRALKTFLYSRSARQRCMKASVPIDGHGHNYMIYVHTSRLSIYILTPTFRVRNIFTIIFFATRAKIWIAHISAGPFFFWGFFSAAITRCSMFGQIHRMPMHKIFPQPPRPSFPPIFGG